MDVRDGTGQTALWTAAHEGHCPCIRLLLAACAHVDAANSEGRTPLQAATYMHHAAAVQMLLAAGAAIDAANVEGFTALHIAAQEGDGPILEQLLQAGAAVSLRTKRGATPLLYAAWSGRAASVLLAAGASISDVDEQGRTALHVAVPEASCCGAAMPAGLGSLARGAAVHLLSAWPADLPPWLPACLPVQGHREVALLLIQRGAATLVQDAQGSTPMGLAPNEAFRAELLAEAAKSRRCATCGAGGKLKKCSRCQQRAYCGPACQLADWPEHKRTCRQRE